MGLCLSMGHVYLGTRVSYLNTFLSLSVSLSLSFVSLFLSLPLSVTHALPHSLSTSLSLSLRLALSLSLSLMYLPFSVFVLQQHESMVRGEGRQIKMLALFVAVHLDIQAPDPIRRCA